MNTHPRLGAAASLVLAALTACSPSTPTSPSAPGTASSAVTPPASSAVTPSAAASAAASAVAATAAAAAPEAPLGQPAPDFTLPSLDGPAVTLSAHKGKIVVLEWFNPECPFVKAAHTEGTLKDMAALNKDVVWLAVNSGAPGKQGNDPAVNRTALTEFALKHPILLDADGKVGRLYGAQRTPHVMVIDATGKLVYRGGLDNSGSGRPSDANPYINHVDQALGDVRAGRPVAVPDTKAWGCSVKYGT